VSHCVSDFVESTHSREPVAVYVCLHTQLQALCALVKGEIVSHFVSNFVFSTHSREPVAVYVYIHGYSFFAR